MNTSIKGHRCACCGKWHPHAPTDFGFQLPDEVWSLSASDRQKRVVSNEELCALDKRRFFIRAVAKLPFTHREGFFGWGIWAEVSKRDFFKYNDQDDSDVNPFEGQISNAPPGYRSILGKSVEVRPGPADMRPTLWFPPSSRHRMAMEQRAGIDALRHHELLHAGGVL